MNVPDERDARGAGDGIESSGHVIGWKEEVMRCGLLEPRGALISCNFQNAGGGQVEVGRLFRTVILQIVELDGVGINFWEVIAGRLSLRCGHRHAACLV